jgi:hypothetical protein
LQALTLRYVTFINAIMAAIIAIVAEIILLTKIYDFVDDPRWAQDAATFLFFEKMVITTFLLFISATVAIEGVLEVSFLG